MRMGWDYRILFRLLAFFSPLPVFNPLFFKAAKSTIFVFVFFTQVSAQGFNVTSVLFQASKQKSMRCLDFGPHTIHSLTESVYSIIFALK